jgi:hypothetical protein
MPKINILIYFVLCLYIFALFFSYILAERLFKRLPRNIVYTRITLLILALFCALFFLAPDRLREENKTVELRTAIVFSLLNDPRFSRVTVKTNEFIGLPWLSGSVFSSADFDALQKAVSLEAAWQVLIDRPDSFTVRRRLTSSRFKYEEVVVVYAGSVAYSDRGLASHLLENKLFCRFLPYPENAWPSRNYTTSFVYVPSEQKAQALVLLKQVPSFKP